MVVFFRSLLQILFVGLFVHFFAHTIVTYGLGVDFSVLWIWKELLLLALGGGALWLCRKKLMLLLSKSPLGLCITLLLCVCMTLFARSFLVSFVFYDQGMVDWMLAVRYNLMPLFIVFVGIGVAIFFSDFRSDASRRFDVFEWLYRFVRWGLLVGLVWYVGVSLFPEQLAMLGYSTDAWQRVYGESPPLRYLTNVRWGYMRNQSLFGGPVSWGLYLIALWPFFWSKRFFGRFGWLSLALYSANIVLTFSRVAWFVFAIQTLALIVLWFWRNGLRSWKFVAKKTFIVSLGLAGAIGLIALLGPADVPAAADRDQGVFYRDLSDKGHVEQFLDGVGLVLEKPLVGWGAGATGPASYRNDDSLVDEGVGDFFHTENQYLQIGVEWGLIGLVLYLAFFVLLLWAVSWKIPRLFSQVSFVSMSRGLGLLGLMAAGMLQHSLVDVQVMYTFMFCFGFFLGSWFLLESST